MPMAAMSRGVAPRCAQRVAHRRALRLPDLERVVLDPAGLRKVLRELALRQRDDAAGGIEQQRARAGGALVEREDELVGRSGAALTVQSVRRRARAASGPRRGR